MIFTLTKPLTFGKYKGRSLEDLMGEDPSYVQWLLEENVIGVSDEDEAEIEDWIASQ